MKVGDINKGWSLFPINPDKVEKKDESFGNVLSEFVQNVNQDQVESNKLLNEFATGGNVEIHDVMIAAEKAKTSLELLMEIRNKSIDMYKELTRMQ